MEYEFKSYKEIKRVRLIYKQSMNLKIYYYLQVFYTVEGSDKEYKFFERLDFIKGKILNLDILNKLTKNELSIVINNYKHLIPDDVLDSDEFIKLVINNI